jgi:hypothetical protein
MRTLHCPSSVVGHGAALAKLERSIGLDSLAIVLESNPYKFGDAVHHRIGRSPLGLWRRLALLRWVMKDIDSVHFNFGASLLPSKTDLSVATTTPWLLRWLYNQIVGTLELKDVQWLKTRGKHISVTFMGDDIRIGEIARMSSPFHPANDSRCTHYSKYSDTLRKKKIRIFDLYADEIYALNPDLLRYLPDRAKFLPYLHVEIDALSPSYPLESANYTTNRPIKIAHAPTNQIVKGTEYVIEAITHLRALGYKFDLDLIQNVDHAESLRRIAECDIFIDQLRIGWYGGVSVEAMALGKAVVCRIAKADLALIPTKMANELPIICATPADLIEVLTELMDDKTNLVNRLGKLSRGFVENWHSKLFWLNSHNKDSLNQT